MRGIVAIAAIGGACVRPSLTGAVRDAGFAEVRALSEVSVGDALSRTPEGRLVRTCGGEGLLGSVTTTSAGLRAFDVARAYRFDGTGAQVTIARPRVVSTSLEDSAMRGLIEASRTDACKAALLDVIERRAPMSVVDAVLVADLSITIPGGRPSVVEAVVEALGRSSAPVPVARAPGARDVVFDLPDVVIGAQGRGGVALVGLPDPRGLLDDSLPDES